MRHPLVMGARGSHLDEIVGPPTPTIGRILKYCERTSVCSPGERGIRGWKFWEFSHCSYSDRTADLEIMGFAVIVALAK